jgi:hypothetical protein
VIAALISGVVKGTPELRQALLSVKHLKAVNENISENCLLLTRRALKCLCDQYFVPKTTFKKFLKSSAQ